MCAYIRPVTVPRDRYVVSYSWFDTSTMIEDWDPWRFEEHSFADENEALAYALRVAKRVAANHGRILIKEFVVYDYDEDKPVWSQ